MRRQHVAHAEDPAGHPVGVEDVEVLELLTGGREQDRDAGDLAHRQSRATAGVAVELGQHHAGEPDALTERLGGGDRVLADHRVEHEDHFVGVHGVAYRAGLTHQLLVDAEATCGVDDDDVVVLGLGLGQARRRDRDRVARTCLSPTFARHAGMRGEDVDTGAFADDLKLVDRTGTLQVTRHQQRRIPLSTKPFRELAGQRGLAGTLQAREHDHRRRGLGERQLAGFAAEDGDQFVVDDLDDLLGRVERARHLGALGAVLDACDEVAHDRQRHVRFQQRQPDLSGRRIDIGVGQPPFAAQPL